AQLLVQPLLELGGLLRRQVLLRVEVRGEHQGLHPPVHAVQEGDAAPDQGKPQDRVAVPDQLQLLLLDHQSLGASDHNGLLLRAPHEDALNQRLSADGGAEGAAVFLFCHSSAFLFVEIKYSTGGNKLQHLFCYALGRVMVTRQPPPSALPMSKVPPWRCMISSHTARPIPLPRALEEPL